MAGFRERKFQLAQGPAAFWEKERGRSGQVKDKQGTPWPLCFQSLLLLILSVNPKATEVAGGVRGC